jgi:hypothetical protein
MSANQSKVNFGPSIVAESEASTTIRSALATKQNIPKALNQMQDRNMQRTNALLKLGGGAEIENRGKARIAGNRAAQPAQ